MRRVLALLLSTAAATAITILPARPAAAALADVSVSVTSNPGSVPVGAPLSYRLAVKNQGSLPTVSVRVNDTQTGGTITGASSGCTVSGGSATCNGTTLAPGATLNFDIFVTAPNVGGTIQNSATVTALFLPTAIDGNQANNSSSATTVVTFGDVAASASSLPAAVSTTEDVIYRLTATNTGGITAATVTMNSSQSGGTFDPIAPTAGCTYPTATTASCALGALAPGASRSIDLVVKAPATVGTITNTATVSATFSPATTDANSGNNTAAVSTPVSDPTPGSFGYIPPGDNMTYLLHTLSVPTGTRGLIAEMNTAAVAAGTMCGTVACNTTNGLHVGISPDPNYQVTNTNNPLTTDVSFGMGDPCRGLGNECTALFWRKDASQAPQQMAPCLLAGKAVPSPCLDRKYKVNGDVHYVVKSLSTDPDYLAPIRSLLAVK